MLARLLGLVCAVTLLVAGSAAFAADDPDRNWWTIETKHFRFHYNKRNEAVAEHIARLSEDIHDRLVEPLGYRPSQRTEVALTDVTDNSNGSATALPYNTVRLFLTAPGDLSALNDYDDWYLALMTHEYTHILHVDNVSGIPSIVNAVLGKTFIPNQLQPRWIIEGLATVAESRFTSGGRVRSSLFDMFLRADFLADNVVRLDQMSNAPRRWPQAQVWYLYGSRFMSWIAEIYGLDVFRAVSQDYSASIIPWGFNRAIRRQTGKTYVELYDGFTAQMKQRYERQAREVERRGLREGRRITFHGRVVQYPEFVPPQARREGSQHQLVYFRDNSHDRPGQYHIDLGSSDGGKYDETFLARALDVAPASFGPDGSMYFSSVVPFKRIYRRSEVFRLEPEKKGTEGREPWRHQLTDGLRASAPTISPSGRHLVFTKNDRGGTVLMVADVYDHKLENIRPLVAPAHRFDQVFTPKFSPDGERVAFSRWTQGGFRDIAIVELATGVVTSVTSDRAVDTNPTWSADSAELYFASDRTGIYNVYRYRLADRALAQVTNARVGALMPTVSHDGKLLAYAGYTTEGWDLFLMELDEARFLPAPPSAIERPDPPPRPPEVPMRKYRYNPIPTLNPGTFSFELGEGLFSAQALSLGVEGADITGNHSYAANVFIDPEAPLPQATLNYTFGRLPVDLNLTLSNRTTPRRDFRFNNQDVEFIEKAYNISSGVSYTDPREFDSQRFSFSYNASILDAELPIATAGPFDPYAEVTREPLQGLLTTIRLGYFYSNVEGSFDTIGAPRGWSLALTIDVGDEFLGSTESLYSGTGTITGYIPMPWPGHHTLAIRGSGGLSTGTYSRRGTFFVGGYNLDNVDLFETLLSGAGGSGFVLRGYDPGAFRGRTYILNNLEYRFPIYDPDRGISTLPFYGSRIAGNLFLDYGGAFDALDFDDIRFFDQGDIIKADQLHTGFGAEIWLSLIIGYAAGLDMRIGYAYGPNPNAIPGGKGYFLAATAF